MNDLFKREWGAVTFVATVLVGAIAVAISLIVAGAKAPPVPPLASCPTYTPYVATPTPSPTATPSGTATTSSTTTSPTPSPTPFNPALQNCPTPPLPPQSTPAPSTSATTSTGSSTTTSSTSTTTSSTSTTTSGNPTPVP
ncbi:MAG: hypothetical protein JOZ75_09735 [Candidatus Dormibacteraeota bacterium]|nr:hypothetical protein [Candidatus Dormibacteraeota bacterium]